MTHQEIIDAIEAQGKYRNVMILADGSVTGVPIDEYYAKNTGLDSIRFIGYIGDPVFNQKLRAIAVVEVINGIS
jgi:hypothetical protein